MKVRKKAAIRIIIILLILFAASYIYLFTGAKIKNIKGADRIIGPLFEILSEKAVKHYEKMKDKGENVYIDILTYEQFMLLWDK